MALIAPDTELIPAMRSVLRTSGVWNASGTNHVYAQFAPKTVIQEGGNIRRWCVLRPVTESPGDWRGDRLLAQVQVAVQSVGWSHKDVIDSASTILDVLHERGLNDRRNHGTLAGTSNWHILNMMQTRAIRIVPNRELGFRWFEYGYQFQVNMEAKNAYV